jgi:hypothetical protein
MANQSTMQWALLALADTLQVPLNTEGSTFQGNLNRAVEFCYCPTTLTGAVRSVQWLRNQVTAVIHLKRDLYLFISVEENRSIGVFFDGAKAGITGNGPLPEAKALYAKIEATKVASIKYSRTTSKWSLV